MVATLDYGLKKAPPEFYDGGQWLVLTQLILHSNMRNRCWPTMRTLAARLHKSLPYVTEAKQWLIQHEAIEIVPFEQRIGEEKKLSGNRHVYQLTGILKFGQLAIRYLHIDTENGEDGEDDDQPSESSTGVTINPVNDQNGSPQSIPSKDTSDPIKEDTIVSSSAPVAFAPTPAGDSNPINGEPDTEGEIATPSKQGMGTLQERSSAKKEVPALTPGAVITQGARTLGIVGDPGAIERPAPDPAAAPKGGEQYSDPLPPVEARAPEGYEYRFELGTLDHVHSANIRHLKRTTGTDMLCRRRGRLCRSWEEKLMKRYPVADCPDCQRIAAERAAPKAAPARKASPWQPFGDALARSLFEAKDAAGVNAVYGRVAPILHGDKKSGRCIGLIAYECQRQGKDKAGLDYAGLAKDVPVFWAWFKAKHEDCELKDCAKVLDYWQAWRTASKSSGGDDAWVWIDDPDVPGGNVKKRVHRDYLYLYQGGAK